MISRLCSPQRSGNLHRHENCRVDITTAQDRGSSRPGISSAACAWRMPHARTADGWMDSSWRAGGRGVTFGGEGQRPLALAHAQLTRTSMHGCWPAMLLAHRSPRWSATVSFGFAPFSGLSGKSGRSGQSAAQEMRRPFLDLSMRNRGCRRLALSGWSQAGRVRERLLRSVGLR